MRKLAFVGIAVVALVAAGIAVANGFEGTRTAKAVVGTFAATTVTKNETQTCTSSDRKLGGSAGGSAVELGPGKCEQTKPEHSEAQGSVSAVSSTSITVAGLTCAVPSSLSAQMANVKVGDRVAIRCEVSNGATTLVKLTSKTGLQLSFSFRSRR